MDPVGKNEVDSFVERLAREHNDDLVRYILRRARSLADARELAQEAYVRLLRLNGKELIREPLAYLYRVAANILNEFEVKQRVDQARLSKLQSETYDECEEGGDPQLEMLALNRVLESTLLQLSPKCRVCVILHRQHGMTYEEIGKTLGLSTAMVKKYLIHGLRHCRKALSEWV